MVHYTTNNGGRDSYIYLDNGGFTSMHNAVKWPSKGSIYEKPSYFKAKPNPVMEAKNIFYKPDGSGRDTYVETTSGGSFNTLQSNYDFRSRFMASLRTYQKSRRETPAQYCSPTYKKPLKASAIPMDSTAE